MNCQEAIVSLTDLIIPKFHDTFNYVGYTHKIFTSGRAGTKSSRGGFKAIETIIEKPCAVVILRKNHNKLRKTVFKECLRAINRLQIDKNDFKITTSPMQITYKDNGSTIYFSGSDSIDDTKGLIDENYPIVLVELDELTEFFDKGDGEDEIMNIEATFVRGNDDIFEMEYYYNPPKNPKAPINEWLNKMKLRNDCIHIHVDYRDVPVTWLGKKLIESADEMRKADEKMYRWIWLGESTGIDDLIYYMFKEDVHVKDYNMIKKPRLAHIGVSVDYGQMNATTFQCFGLDTINKKVQGIDEYYYSGRDTGKQKSPSDYAKDFKCFVEDIEKRINQKVSFAVIDPSAKGLAEEIKRIIPRLTIITGNSKNEPKINAVKKGIGRVQKLLSFKILQYDSKQVNCIDENYYYQYDEKSIEAGDEKPLKVNDHCKDAERYYIMAVWKYILLMLPKLRGKEDDN